MTTYIIDVQTQHTGTELELLEGMLFGETLRKIRTLQVSLTPCASLVYLC